MKIVRRKFLAALGGGILWPLAADAQQAMPVIGVLSGSSGAGFGDVVTALKESLSQEGYLENRDVKIEYRWADNQYDRLPVLAADLVRIRPAVIIAAGSAAAALAAKSATATIPIVFQHGSDPVALGLVSSLNRPGGNVTGVTILTVEAVQKRVEILRELVPTADRLALLVNPNNPNIETYSRDVAAAAQALERRIDIVTVALESEFESAFATLVQRHIGAVAVTGDPIFVDGRDHLVALATRHAIPAMYPYREFITAGGLMSYGPNRRDSWRQVGLYTARILKGAGPADLPVVQVTKLDLIINQKTARSLGIEVPLSLLMRIDEVID
jgi:putative tryptophan/tyrosine transport system substrate-binding protein